MSQSEMREPTLLVLTSLAAGRKHGYALIAEAADLSRGRVKLKAGTLYAVLDRLVDQGLAEVAGDEIVDGRNRRYFEITSRGEDALRAEAERLEANAAAVRSRLETGRATTGLATVRIVTARLAAVRMATARAVTVRAAVGGAIR